MSEVMNGVLVVTYGEYKIADFDALPTASKLALAQSGLTHKLGNEVAASVSALIKKALVNASGDPKHEPSRDDAKAFRAANTALVAQWTKEEADETFAEILAGTIGTRAGGPRGPKLDEFASLVRDFATRYVENALVNNQKLARNAAGVAVVPETGKAPVSGGKTPWTITIAGKPTTIAALVDAQLAKPDLRAKFEADAKAEMARRAKAAERVTVDSLDSLA